MKKSAHSRSKNSQLSGLITPGSAKETRPIANDTGLHSLFDKVFPDELDEKSAFPKHEILEQSEPGHVPLIIYYEVDSDEENPDQGIPCEAHGICTPLYENDSPFEKDLDATLVLKRGNERMAVWLFAEPLVLTYSGGSELYHELLETFGEEEASLQGQLLPSDAEIIGDEGPRHDPETLLDQANNYFPKRSSDREDVIDAPEEPQPIQDTDAEFFGDWDSIQPLLERKIQFGFARNLEDKKCKSHEVPVIKFLFHNLLKHREGEKGGPAFTQGWILGGRRQAKNIRENHIVGLDMDTGEPMASMREKIQKRGLFAVMYTTHSHGSEYSTPSSDEVRKFHKKKYGEEIDQLETEHVVEFLIDEKRYWPDLLEGAEFIEEVHEEGGFKAKIKHKPMDKYRVVCILSQPFVFAERGSPQQDAINEWKERYAGFGNMLDAAFDRSTTDPSRIFFLPRHNPGADYKVWVIGGNALDFEAIPRRNDKPTKTEPRKNKQKTADESFALEGNTGTCARDYQYRNSWIIDFVRNYGECFNACDWVCNLFGPDEIVDTDRAGGKVSVPCPNIDSHSKESPTGFFVTNAGHKGYKGFHMQCSHDGCRDLHDRAIWLDLLVDEFEATEDELLDYVDEFEIEEEVEEGVRFAGKLTYPPRKKMNAEEHAEWHLRQLNEINEEFAVIAHDKPCILYQPRADEKRSFHFWRLSDLRTYFLNCPIMVAIGKTPPKDKTKEADKAWLAWPKRREYAGIEFEPDPQKANPKFFNTFRGFATPPDPNGDWSRLRQHLKSMICHDNDEWDHWVMTWLAHIVQMPGEKINTCLVIKGAQGTGKSTLGEILIELFGESVALMVDDPNALTGTFTSQLSGKLLIVDEEATFAANPAAADKLKSVTAGRFLYINEKFVSPRQEKNFLRILKLTNSEWAIKKEVDDRRYSVLEIKPDHQQDLEYFAAIHDQMKNSNGLGAMMHDLMNWEPSDQYGGWDCIRTPLKTVWGDEQAEMSSDLLDMFIEEFLEKKIVNSPDWHDDEIPTQPYFSQTDGSPFIKPSDLLKHFAAYCRSNSILGRPPAGSTRSPAALMKRLAKRLKMKKLGNTSLTPRGGDVVKGHLYEIVDRDFLSS